MAQAPYKNRNASVFIEVGVITRMTDSLFIAERAASYGGETKHCGTMPEGMDWIRKAVSMDLVPLLQDNIEIAQWQVGYYSLSGPGPL